MCNKKNDFVHLHCHTHYSMQDALPTAETLADTARNLGQPACAITDHGKMGGVIEFVKACRGKNADEFIKPIIGCELYMAEDLRVQEQVMRDDGHGGLKKGRPKHWHLTTLVKNHTGYRNLMNIASIAEEEGFYYDPRADWDLLSEHGDGLIVLSGCLGSEFNQKLLKGDEEGAEAVARRFKERFGENYFVELQFHGIPEQKMILPKQIAIAEKLGIPLVASNDVHYAKANDWLLHDVHIQMRNTNDDNSKTNGKKQAYASHQFFLKSREEMSKMFGSKPQALDNTLLISDMVEDFLNLNVPHLLPAAKIPTNNEQFNDFKRKFYPYHQPHEAYLAYLAHLGLHKLGKSNDPIYKARLKTELDQIMYMGVSDYFLIQKEMVEFMRENDIWYGIRGSGVGSLVNYCLKISSADPIVWNLMFQRFLNPGRGTQYKIDYKEFPFTEWYDKNGKLDQEKPTLTIKERCREKLQSDTNLMQYGPRIAKEIWILENQGLAAYILDMANKGIKAKQNDSQLWVTYLLGIAPKPESDLIVSSVAPLPDVDSDISPMGRERVIDWARERFGKDQVCQIGTYNKYGAKAAITGTLKSSDQFRTKYGEKTHVMAQYISKLIPYGHDLNTAVQEVDELQRYAKTFSEQFETAKQLIGTISSAGVHAGGVLISSEPIRDHSPLIWATSKKCTCSAYDMHSLEHVGLTKYDLLGVDFYDILSYAVRYIKERRGVAIDLEKIAFDDPKVFNLYANGKTTSTFQFSSPGMQEALKKVSASNMEDLIAVVALFRPGPMAYIDQYAEGKRNPNKVKYSHPIIKQHLEVTFGIPVYQEQAMFIAKDLAGFDWDEVDKMRKAVSKKDPVLFAKVNKLFREKASARNVSNDVINDILTMLEKFAGYAFNRSHACGYAILSYLTGYLRVYYTPEWLAACMQIKRHDPDQLAIYRKEARSEGITIIEPDINKSKHETYVTKEGAIVLPISTVKGVGDSGNEILKHAPFENFRDLVFRARPNRGTVEHLLEGRALRSLNDISNKTPEQIMTLLDEYVAERKIEERYAAKLAKQKYVAVDLFGDTAQSLPVKTPVAKKELPKIAGPLSKKLMNKDLFK